MDFSWLGSCQMDTLALMRNHQTASIVFSLVCFIKPGTNRRRRRWEKYQTKVWRFDHDIRLGKDEGLFWEPKKVNRTVEERRPLRKEVLNVVFEWQVQKVLLVTITTTTWRGLHDLPTWFNQSKREEMAFVFAFTNWWIFTFEKRKSED